ncbi:cytochrome P450 [Aurantimonas sp. VKM B-3413]|uniref:cytochrome P450 n=1 Tax=Aurantimonas sp. VKM B-3413 TaxID=2779401 RepID=UPI001E61967A|nr:cytochrome P450 [Aurantimonas sp. VKM B-3413]MCB8836286.1 cytochrome P450 [Aurantimonas sp. VKM B-3413]
MDTISENFAATIDLNDLWNDPYPIYERLRKEAPVAFVPAANRYLVTRHADIVELERKPEIFSAHEANSLMIRVMGHTMIRKDGAAHKRERTACEPALRPGVVKNKWIPTFQAIVDELIDGFEKDGAVDLFDRFAGPCASLSLIAMLGLKDVDQKDLRVWSQAMMDATGNYADDPKVWRRSDEAAAGVDAALDVTIPYLQAHPDESLISCMLHAEDPLSREEISANVKVIIGGGLNEPRDAIATGAYALLKNDEQRSRVEADPALWRKVFEETVRWVSPIGMYPRQTAIDTELAGVPLPAGSRIGVVLAAANRDESVFEDADRFDIDRPKKPHVAFGGGPHFCLGAWAARAQVGEIALPTLFSRLKNLRLDESDPVRFGGWVFRGPLNLPARWDA